MMILIKIKLNKNDNNKSLLLNGKNWKASPHFNEVLYIFILFIILDIKNKF